VGAGTPAERHRHHFHGVVTAAAEVGVVHGTVPRVWMITLPGGRAGAVPVK
jgi:hypothetical protein